MFKPLRNNFLIKADSDSATNLNLIGVDGNPLIIPKRFNPLHHTQQYGEIIEVPFEFDEESIDTKNLKIGDKIFFHYLVCDEVNKMVVNDVECYLCPFNQIWAKVENEKLIPLDDVLFAKYVIDDRLTSESGLILKQYESNIVHRAIASSTSNLCKLNGINDGDMLVTIKAAGVPMKDSQDTVWMKLSNIVGVEKDGEVYPQIGMHLIKEDEIPDITMWKGQMIGNMHRKRFLTGEYIRGKEKIERGHKVTFIHSLFSRIELDGVKYAVVRDRDLIFTD